MHYRGNAATPAVPASGARDRREPPIDLTTKPAADANASESPPDEHRSHGEACADGREQDEVALLEPVRAYRVVQGQGDGRGRRIPEAFDVDDDLAGWDA